MYNFHNIKKEMHLMSWLFNINIYKTLHFTQILQFYHDVMLQTINLWVFKMK